MNQCKRKPHLFEWHDLFYWTDSDGWFCYEHKTYKCKTCRQSITPCWISWNKAQDVAKKYKYCVRCGYSATYNKHSETCTSPELV